MKPHHVIDGPAEAPVLVLGPSLGTTLALFDPQVAALAGEYRLVRFDLREHGSSPGLDGPHTIEGLAGDVLELAYQLAIRRFHHAERRAAEARSGGAWRSRQSSGWRASR
jgi:3-oxoadipate enol-lactonase